MEIEHLSKSQIVLLTLFTSFVSAIASGIVTFSLMQQAPPTITQTVNRIVERTVEKAAPVSAALAAVPVKTVITEPKREGGVAHAVESTAPSVVHIYTRDPENPKLLGLGIVLTPSGIIATDSWALGEAGDAVADVGGARVRVFVTRRDAASGIAFLTATTSPDQAPVAWRPVVLAAKSPVLGQAAVALSGRAAMRLGIGFVTSVDTMPETGLMLFGTDIAESTILPGTPLTDETGALVGLSTGVSRHEAGNAFISADALISKEDKK